MLEGVVLKSYSNFFEVAAGGERYLCTLRGRFRKENISILTGDRVKLASIKGDKAVIDEVMPRKSELVRPAIANVDQVLIVLAVSKPALNLNLLDRMTVIAQSKDLDIVILFNKADLLDNMESSLYDQVLDEMEWYRRIGFAVILTSQEDASIIEAIRSVGKGKISVLAGPSGVGKSSILNIIRPSLGLRTGAVSVKSGQGRHTTRHVELLPLGYDGFIADSPGFSILSFEDITPQGLAYCFPEMEPYIPTCRFSTCLHHKEPDCGVKQAVEDGYIHQRRYENYVTYLLEIMENERRY
jgi:ribosome biogenesis GTPase